MRLLALSAFAWPAAAQFDVSLEAEPNPVTAGETFSLTVTVSGASPEAVNFDTVPNLTIDTTQQPSVMNSWSNINGKISQFVKVEYTAQIDKPGTVKLPPAVVTINGKDYKTNAISITAVEHVDRPGPTLADGVRVACFVDKTDVYEGEAIKLTLEIWELDGVSVKGVSQVPSTVGFYTVPQEPVPSDVVTKQFDGLDYRVRQNIQLLYPTHSGQLQIGKMEWNGQVAGVTYERGYSRRVRGTFMRASDPIMINVKPLPERPDGFAGAVGSFLVEGNLSTPQVDLGVPFKLRVHITGRGNPRAITPPRVPDLEWAHVAEPIRTDAAPEIAIEGKVDQYFDFAVTPHEPGDQTIPRMQFVYFDPEREDYEYKGIGPFEITVFPSNESDRPVVYDGAEKQGTSKIDILATDIQPIVGGGRNLTRGGGVPIAFWIAAFAPVCIYAAAAGYVLRRRRFERDRGYARAYRARSEAHRELRGVLGSANPEESLHRALIQYIANKFDAPEASMTAHDAETILRSNGCDDELCKNARTILRRCERAVYASESLPEAEMRALVHGAAAIIDQTKSPNRKRRTT